MLTGEEVREILERDVKLRSRGNNIIIRQQLDLIIYNLIFPFDAENALPEQIVSRAVNFARLDILLGRASYSPEFVAGLPQDISELLEHYKAHPPPASEF